MQFNNVTVARQSESILATNAVVRNTYLLLGMTLLFSALTAGLAMWQNAAPLNPFITILGYFGLLFLANYTRNSAWGLVSVFALTGFMGYTLGPILNYYIQSMPNGHETVVMSLGGTGIIFFGLSGYALVSKKDFTFMGGALTIGLLVAFLLGIGALVFNLPALTMAVSAMFILLSSGVILFQTSQIIHGGETNYIMATITLYVSLYNIFLSLLSLLGGNRE